MVSLIVAKSRNNAIGKNEKIPWNIKEDLLYFRKLTLNSTVIMGRKTYESIGHPLDNRVNIVISNTKKYKGDNLYTFYSLKDAINFANGLNKEIYIIGGERLYKEAIELVDKMYITEVFIYVRDADAFFPKVDDSLFDISYGKIMENGIKYRQDIYIRRR